ncbi:MAG: nucleotide exchange factor GrpE, partial [Patescibacteria group bacterium]
VGALIANQDGLILLARNRKCFDKYTIPGGHVELGESLEEAVLREVKEEIGIDVAIAGKIGFSEAVFHENFQEGKHFVFLDFVCLYDGEKEAISLDEKEYVKDDYVWVDPEGALKMDIAVGTRNVIERYLEEKKKVEYLSGWQRCLADFKNYKKRQLEIQRNAEQFSKERMILEILPVIDNFEASLAHVPEKEKDSAWVVGINHIKTQLENILKDNGISEIETKAGDEFDPEIHEAVSKGEEGKEKNKIAKVVQKGYRSGGRVIRATKVTVN